VDACDGCAKRVCSHPRSEDMNGTTACESCGYGLCAACFKTCETCDEEFCADCVKQTVTATCEGRAWENLTSLATSYLISLVPCDSITRVSKCVSMTWRALSARPYVEANAGAEVEARSCAGTTAPIRRHGRGVFENRHSTDVESPPPPPPPPWGYLRTSTRPTLNLLLFLLLRAGPTLNLLLLLHFLLPSGVAENKRSIDVESPHPPPCVCMSIPHPEGKCCSDLG
jgi:hypothetical protein